VSYFFQDALNYLRQAGAVFARAHPKLAPHLGGGGDDPDVERLLEGFAYLSGRVQENMAHESVEFNHAMISVLWPNFLRPLPSATLMCLKPKAGMIQGCKIVPAGTVVSSRLIDGINCPFRTTSDCTIYPLELRNSELETGERLQMRLHFSTLDAVALGQLGLRDLRLHFVGEMPERQMLYLWFGRYLKAAVILFDDGRKTHLDLKKQLAPIGFARQESLLPHPAAVFEGTRLLQEFFTFPDKFYGYDLKQLERIFAAEEVQNFTLELTFERALPASVRVRPDSVALHCVSAVNLFTHDGDPLLIRHEKTAYPVRPSGQHAPLLEIFSVDGVRAVSPSRDSRRRALVRSYPSFESFLHEGGDDHGNNATGQQHKEAQIYYYLRPHRSRRTSGFDYEISFIQRRRADELTRVIPDEEAVSLELSCFNRSLCHELAIGDIGYPRSDAPDFVTYRNIVRPSMSVHPPLDGTLNWNLLANLALNYTTLLDRDAMAAILAIYDYESFASAEHERMSAQRIDGICALDTQPVFHTYQGLAVRGLKSVLRLRESAFHTEGEMYLFALILSEFFTLCSTVNSFHELEVWGEENGEIYQWPVKIGGGA